MKVVVFFLLLSFFFFVAKYGPASIITILFLIYKTNGTLWIGYESVWEISGSTWLYVYRCYSLLLGVAVGEAE